jgi:hypothetical protein
MTRMTALSANGRYVAYGTYSTHIDPADTSGFNDFYVLDRTTVVSELVNLGYDGEPANADEDSFHPPLQVSISGSGRYVTLDTPATNMVPGHGNDVFWSVATDAMSNRNT